MTMVLTGSFSLLSWLSVLALFTISVQLCAQDPGSPHHPRVRVHFIAAEEIEWDYAPSGRDEAMGHPFHNLEKIYLERGPHRIGRISKKCVYREYTDAKFNHLIDRNAEDQYLGMLGPVLYGEVGDTLKIFFKNNASRPYSMHPHGVLYQKDSEGSEYDDGTSGKDKEDDAVPPGGSHIYMEGAYDVTVSASGFGTSTSPSPKKLHGKFFWYFMRSSLGREQFQALVTSTAKETITVPKLKTILVPLPSLSEQQRIVEYFDDLQKQTDTLRALQDESSAELDDLMPSILDRAFRGELVAAAWS